MIRKLLIQLLSSKFHELPKAESEKYVIYIIFHARKSRVTVYRCIKYAQFVYFSIMFRRWLYHRILVGAVNRVPENFYENGKTFFFILFFIIIT